MSDSSYSASSSPSRTNEMEAFATLSIRFSSHVILPSSRTSAGFGSIDFGWMPRGRSRWRFNFLPAAVKLWTLRVTVCRFAFLSYAMSSSTQTTPMIFVIVASRTGTFLFTIFADLSAIREDELDDLELLFRLGAMGLLREMRLEAAAGLFQREVQLRHDLVCGGHGLFRFGGVGHFRRTEVDEDDCGAEREARTAPLL